MNNKIVDGQWRTVEDKDISVDLFGDAIGVVDVPAEAVARAMIPVTDIPRPPMPWRGIDPRLPLTVESIDEILEMFETWCWKNVAPRKRKPSPRTIQEYTRGARQFLEWLLTQTLPELPAWYSGPELLWNLWVSLDQQRPVTIPLLLITPELMQTYMEWLVAPGHGDNSVPESQNPRDINGAYSAATLGKKRAALQRFFTFTRKKRYTFGNPLDDMEEVVRMPADNRSKVERIKALTRQQAEHLLSLIMDRIAIAKSPGRKVVAMRDLVMVELMMLQGLRNIEVHRLNLEDYEPNARGEQGALHVLGKGDKERTVLLRPEVQEDMNSYLTARALYKPNTPAIFINLHTSGASGGGGPAGPNLQRLSQRSIRIVVDKYLEKAGLKRDGVSCHALRHTYATLYVEMKGSEVNREVLAASMGHSDTKITDVYIDFVDIARHNPAEPLMEIRNAAKKRSESKKAAKS